MTSHLPECFVAQPNGGDFCICPELDAYHDRIADEIAYNFGDGCGCNNCNERTPTRCWTPPARQSFNPDWFGTPDWEEDDARNKRVAAAIELAIAKSYERKQAEELSIKQPWYKRIWQAIA